MYTDGIMDMKLLGTFRDCRMRLKSTHLCYAFRTVRYIFDLWTDNLSVDMIVTVFFRS